MSATATASPPTRRCERCEAPMASEQAWCLECGTESVLPVSRPRRWILPAGIILAVLAAAVAAVVLVAQPFDDDSGNAASEPTSTSTTGAKAVSSASTARGKASGAAGSTRPASTVPLWPRARTAYTVVVAAPTGRADAVRRARGLRKLGRDAGILRSDDYDFFGPGLWVVWRGKYPTRAAAEGAEVNVQRVVPSAYATLIRRRGA